MKIFFAAPIKEGRAHQPEFKAIIAALEHYGSVHAPHTADTAFSHYGETGIPDKDIFDRELAALAAADVVVTEVTTPGLGVGYLLAQAVSANKRVLAMYRGENALKLSSMIKGDPKITVLLYKDEADIKTVLAEALK